MTINYKRLIKTPLYIMGCLNINGEPEYFDTLELTNAQIPGNLMRATLIKTEEDHARVLALVGDDFDYLDPDANNLANKHCLGRIAKGVSYRNLKDKTGLLIGYKDFPGSLRQSRKIYDRLVDRIEKCLNKKGDKAEIIQFVVHPSVCIELNVHPYWLGDPKHGCPPTSIHCATNENGDVLVYDKNDLIKIHTVEEQRKRYNSEISKSQES